MLAKTVESSLGGPAVSDDILAKVDAARLEGIGGWLIVPAIFLVCVAFAVTDYFNYRAFTFAPRSSALEQVARAVEEYWRRQGGDLEIQGRLPAILRAQQLEVTEIRRVSRVARPGESLWDWPASFFRGFLPRLEQAGLVDADLRSRFWDDWQNRSADPDAYMFLPPMIDIIGRKAATS